MLPALPGTALQLHRGEPAAAGANGEPVGLVAAKSLQYIQRIPVRQTHVEEDQVELCRAGGHQPVLAGLGVKQRHFWLPHEEHEEVLDQHEVDAVVLDVQHHAARKRGAIAFRTGGIAKRC